MTSLRIGLDVDGCMYDFVDALRRHIHQAIGRPLDSMPNAATWDFYKLQWGLSIEEFLGHCRDGVLAGVIFTEGDPYPGAAAATRALAAAGHELHVVTARAIPGAVAEAEAATAGWLERHSIPYSSLTVSAAKDAVPTDVFLEDDPANYDLLTTTPSMPWLYTQPWNAHHPGRRVHGWGEFYRVVQQMAGPHPTCPHCRRWDHLTCPRGIGCHVGPCTSPCEGDTNEWADDSWAIGDYRRRPFPTNQ